MTLTPLASRSPGAVRAALVRRGMEEHRAAAVVQGLHPVALIFDALTPDSRDAVAECARQQGLECVAGDDWALLAGSAARLAGMARTGSVPLPRPLVDELGQYLRGVVEPPEQWVTARGSVGFDRPVIVGILNVTPDSFSDGGRYLSPDAALRHADAMLEAGADMIDVGAESTRPGSPDPVPAAEEWRRLAPVVAELARMHPQLPLSVDTVKSETAQCALDAGAWAINDVSGLRLDPRIADVCAARGAGLILMHSRGSFSEMASYDHVVYGDVTAETVRELAVAVELAELHGMRRDQLVLDPGLGFSKKPEQNYEVLGGLQAVASLSLPVMVGPSRKRFLAAVTGDGVSHRDVATAAACVVAYLLGASMFRVHDVSLVRGALAVVHAVRST